MTCFGYGSLIIGIIRKNFAHFFAKYDFCFLHLYIISSRIVVRSVLLSDIEGGAAGGQRSPQGLPRRIRIELRYTKHTINNTLNITK